MKRVKSTFDGFSAKNTPCAPVTCTMKKKKKKKKRRRKKLGCGP